MLTRRLTAAAAAAAVTLLGAVAPGTAVADDPGGGVVCPPRDLDCDVTAHDPGKPPVGKPGTRPGKPPSEGGLPTCAIDGEEVPCSTPEMGAFNSADSCYWKPTDGPAGGLPTGFDTGAPPGWKPGDPGGRLYLVTCPRGGDVRGGIRWSATGPAGGGVDVQALARQAVERLRLEGPDIGIVPRPDGKGLVGLPVWMWNKPGPTRTGPTTATASAGSVTVTATATVRTVVWSMGDGATITCTGPGTPYTPDRGKEMSPTCGHKYTRTSDGSPGGRYPVTATTTWDVAWEGAGQTGTITTTRQSATSLAIGELQVLNVP
ncbi:ATP/GTP-binding protein [Streptomyces virginiae]|uniref:ATP/GTP-binding protein n=1 Tax=Streptomyces virginiae TaxID=1961 RepID=UPI0032523C5A